MIKFTKHLTICVLLLLAVGSQVEANELSKVKNLVEVCYQKGYYTKAIVKKVNANDNLYQMEVLTNIKDFCQQTHEMLYPQDRDTNRAIRNLID